MFRRIMDSRILFIVLLGLNVTLALTSALAGDWGQDAMSGGVAAFMLTVWS